MEFTTLENEMYGVQVVFNERGYWSKPYTYIYSEKIEKGTVVVVPTNNFFSVAKVLESIKDFPFKENIKYKHIALILNIKAEPTNV